MSKITFAHEKYEEAHCYQVDQSLLLPPVSNPCIVTSGAKDTSGCKAS